jgi:hypothetical protein
MNAMVFYVISRHEHGRRKGETSRYTLDLYPDPDPGPLGRIATTSIDVTKDVWEASPPGTALKFTVVTVTKP